MESAIVVASVWLFAAVCWQSKNVSNTGMLLAFGNAILFTIYMLD
jgi:threonine/homoserine efflux transporter RhtA